MYQLLLTRKYLTHKIMPLLAAAAVMLCTAMVLVAWSIMGGFLNMLLASGRTLVGDVTVTWPTTGFAHYEEFIADLEKEPEVAAACPIIETFGMVSLPDGRVEGVQIKGIDGERYARVTEFRNTVHWKPLQQPTPRDSELRDPRLIDVQLLTPNDATSEQAARLKELIEQRRARMAAAESNARTLTVPDAASGEPRPAAMPGIEMSGFSERNPGGFYTQRSMGRPGETGSVEWLSYFMPEKKITLSVLPLDKKGRDVQMVSRTFPVANEFRTGVFEIDKRTVLVNLGALQKMLQMDAARRVDAAKIDPYVDAGPGTQVSIAPARVTTVLVRAKEGVTPEDLRRKTQEVYDAFSSRHRGEVPAYETMIASRLISTWEQNQSQMIGAVKKETGLVLFILGFISFTSSFLILAIFWAMVSEKTKDIGVLRSLGASGRGVAATWLAYGVFIGVIGAALGGLLAYGVVTNINPIHESIGNLGHWLARTLNKAFGTTYAFNWYLWDPRVYYFTEIPRRVEPLKAAIILSCGVLFCVLGALVPAWRAAKMDPVRALRFE